MKITNLIKHLNKSFVFNFINVRYGKKKDAELIKYVDFEIDQKRHLLYKKKRYYFLRKYLQKSRDKIRKNYIEIINANYQITFDNLAMFEFSKHDDPVVSIVIPVFNNWETTYNCLVSIYYNTGNDVKYEIIIADDNSSDETVNIEKYFKNICRIKNLGPKGFLGNCNNAAKVASGRYILFLNNDTLVQLNWLTALVSYAELNHRAAICGSKLVYYKNKMLLLQEAGGIVYDDASARNYGRDEIPCSFEYSYVKEVDYVSGASMLIRKTFWKSCGGFDPLYLPAYYEDTDICYQARKFGYSVCYIPGSVVIHLEGISNGRSLNSGLKKHQVENRVKFLDRWKSVLSTEKKEIQDDFLLRDRSQFTKIIVVFDSKIPSFDTNAGARSTDQYVDLLKANGFTVKFISTKASGDRELLYYQNKGIETIPGNIPSYIWKDWIRIHAKDINYVFINRPYVAQVVLPVVKRYTNAKIIYQGHDLHFLRLQRDFELTGNPESLKESKEIRKIEKRVLSNVEYSFFFSEEEVSIIKKEFGIDNVWTTPLFLYDKFPENTYDSFSRRDLLFVGGFAHQPNCDAMSFFLEKCFPEIVNNLNGIKIFIVGSKAPDYLLKKKSDNVVFTGYLSDEAMENLYNQVRLVVAPLRFGAGIKGKIIESMYKNVPVITTTVGAEGIPDAQTAMSIVTDMAVYADSLIALYNDCERLNGYSKNASICVKKHFSKDIAQKLFFSHFVD